MQCPSAKVNVYTAGVLGVAFFATGSGWVLKCISFCHSNFPYFFGYKYFVFRRQYCQPLNGLKFLDQRKKNQRKKWDEVLFLAMMEWMDGFLFLLSCFLKVVFHNDTLKKFQVAVGWKTATCCFTTHTIRLYCLKQSRHYVVIYTKCQITAKNVIRKKTTNKNIYLRFCWTFVRRRV